MHHYSIIRFYHALPPKTPFAFPIQPFPKPLKFGSHWSVYCFYSLMSYKWKNTVCSFFRMASFTQHYALLHSNMLPCLFFFGFIAHFCNHWIIVHILSLNKYTTICLFIHLLKDILVDSSFWQFELSFYSHSHKDFHVDLSFQIS